MLKAALATGTRSPWQKWHGPRTARGTIGLLGVLLALALAPTLLLAAVAQTTGPLADHLVLISIDGLRPEFYRDPSWPAPTLQLLAASGVSADRVRGVYPSVTYPSHTTIITGVLPARHGIFYNSPFEPQGQSGRWYWEASAIRVPTLWDAVRRAGGTSASLAWPVSVGAPVDYNLPEIWSLKAGFGTVAPVRQAENPPGLLAEIEREATGKLTDADMSVEYLRRDTLTAAAAAYLIETYRPTLVTLHLIGVDHFAHADGRDSHRVRFALAAIDTSVREVLDATQRAGIEGRTAIVITGDHGFINVHTTLAPNVWLARAGLTGTSTDRGDWRASFHTTAASAFLHLRDPDDAAAARQVVEILDALPAAQRKLFRVLDRKELDALGAAPEAVLALAPVAGVTLTASALAPVLRSAHGGTHGFHPDLEQIQTGFIGWGAGFATQVRIPQMGLQDIAPIVAQVLGLELDNLMSCQFCSVVIDVVSSLRHPPERIETSTRED